jgi:hypothetical protein
MAASPLTRALLVGLAALALTIGGFLLGRRASEPEPSPSTAAVPPPGVDETEGVAGVPPANPDAGPPSATSALEAPSAPPGGARAARPAPRVPRSAPSEPLPSSAPGPPQAAEPGAAPAAGRRGFVAGLTQIGSTRPSNADLKGFDPAAVALKRAPQSDGAIEFEVVPAQVAPAQAYTVKVYLRNRSPKPLRVKTLSVASEMNGHGSRSELSPRSKVVEPSLVGLLTELPGVWKHDVSSWSLEVEVLTAAGDTYASRMDWK